MTKEVVQGLVMAFDANLSDSTGGSSIRIAIGHRQHSRKKQPRPGHGFLGRSRAGRKY